jgi:type II secretory ATPase GspE/PulE/Tfp pilus assembly ATPase PilB-like protein
VLNSEVRALILKRASSAQIREKACKFGMKTLRQDGLAKVLAGMTTLSEVERVTQKDVELEGAV